MKSPIAILRLTLLGLLAALAVRTGVAQPSGSITNLVLSPTNALWDFGAFSNQLQYVSFTVMKATNQKTNTEAQFSYSDPYSQEGGGKVSGGPAITSVNVSLVNGTLTTSYNGAYRVSGSVTSAEGLATLTFRTKVTGAGYLEGFYKLISGSATFTVKVDSLAGQVSGRIASSVTTEAITISSATSFGPQSLSEYERELGNGTWTLVLKFGQTIGNALSGNATVTLNSGTVYSYTFTGTFTPRTGVSKLNLQGYDTQQAAAAGSMLLVTLNSSNQVARITGRVGGQTVKLTQ